MGINDVVIVNGVQTAVGGFGGSLKDVLAQDSDALVIKETATRADISPGAVDEVIIGRVGQIAEGGFVGKAVSLKVRFPRETTAYSVGRQCGSGPQAVVKAVVGVQTERADVCVTRGTENVSRLPYYIKDAQRGARIEHKVFEDGVVDVLTQPLGPYRSGVTTENVAEQYHVNREEQGVPTLESHRRTVQAVKAGKFRDEIVSVELKDRRGNITIFNTDEGPREGLTIKRLQKPKPCFVENRTITAGNASSLDSGVGAMIIMLNGRTERLGCKPLLMIKGYTVIDSDEAATGYVPRLSSEKLAAELGLDLISIDMAETNEALASQAYAMKRDLGSGPERTNTYRGGVSIGHSIGATGVILAVKVTYGLQRANKKDVVVSVCIGGGQDISMYFTKPE